MQERKSPSLTRHTRVSTDPAQYRPAPASTAPRVSLALEGAEQVEQQRPAR